MTRTANLGSFKPDPANAGPALRRALAAPAPNEPGQVRIPAGDWVFREPILLDRDGTELVGESPSATTLSLADYGPGIFAYKRAAFRPARRVDAFGLLDLATCPGPGQLWGLAFGLDSWHIVPAFPPTTGRGDGWADLPGLTFSLGLDGPPADGTIFGLGDRQGPMPVVLACDYEPGLGRRVFRLIFATADRPRAPREITFGDAGAPGPMRIDLQMRFDRAGRLDGLCDIRCWQAGRETPALRGWGTRLVEATADEPAFTVGDAVKFERNRLANFKLAAGSFSDHTTQGKGGSFATFGLLLACDYAFGTDGAGNQTRADGGPVDDAYRYLHAGRSQDDLIARMSLARSDGPDSPIVRWNSGARTGSVAGMGFTVGDGADPVKALTIRDLTVRMPGHGGSAILFGPVLGLTLDRVTAGGGAHGLAGLNCGASYDVTLRGGCAMGGTDAWIKGTDLGLDVDGLARDYVPGSALVFSGCNVRCGPIRTGDVTGGRPVIDVVGYNAYDSQYEFAHLSVDQEQGEAVVGIRCEKSIVGTRLVLGTIGAGLRDGVTPVVDLVDRMPQGPRGNAPGRCLVRGLIVGEPDVRCGGDWTVEPARP